MNSNDYGQKIQDTQSEKNNPNFNPPLRDNGTYKNMTDTIQTEWKSIIYLKTTYIQENCIAKEKCQNVWQLKF